MPRSDAVTLVTGEIFREGWSRIRGSMQGLGSRRAQMVRAAYGHRAAVFKPIRSGGTHTKAQLQNQLAYLTTKSSHIVDSRSVHDGKARLTGEEITSMVERFTSRWDEGFHPKLGHTSHLLMSFPRGTKGTHVRDIASDVCERFFQNADRTFDYLIAVHKDRDHPHAHVVINRRSQEGEFFYLGRDHHFNYDAFRLAMVEEAEKYGVRLEANRRIARGEVHYPPRTREVYAAKEEGRAVRQRERIGEDLDRALGEIAGNAQIYRSLAAEASPENCEDMEAALLKASVLLARRGALPQTGDIYMSQDQSFDDLNSRFADEMNRVAALIREAPEADRPTLQKQMVAALRPVAHMQPLGLRSGTLTERPTETGIYSEANINAGLVERLREGRTRAQIETALRGTGISSEAVVARIEQGANTAALEREWYADDLQKIAEAQNLNLERREDLKVAVDTLDKVHVALGTALERAEVLRRDGVIEDDHAPDIHYDAESVDDAARAIRQDMRGQGLSQTDIAERADEITIRAEARLEQEQRAYLRRHPELPARPSDVIDARDPFNVRIVDEAQADRTEADIDHILARSAGAVQIDAAVAAEMRARYPDMPEHLARGLGATYAATFAARRSESVRDDRDATHKLPDNSLLAGVVAHERTDKITPPFADEEGRAAYRAEVERFLDDERIAALRNGDADAFDAVIDNRLDRLYAAKAYLQSDEATANSDAVREVVSEIAEEEYDAQRLKSLQSHTEKGQTHG
ncbi:relaxase/mobilization nuclease domain-containing protein [uncultured Tateyamaria sp.]|uniref:relaxase/mobilization nuclease domain-containing protein n=1 Tax=uncultured Tateyamaria sp. TaxID=455651 RepID=UPI002632917D|nr:relaxase/mobilization nuclease domain-containing protein [uncultured Tateyamaria sp.]